MDTRRRKQTIRIHNKKKSLPTLTPSRAPSKRRDCPKERPCPYVSCRYHLLMDVLITGNIKVNFPEIIDECDCDMSMMAETCALDVADRGGVHLAEIGRYMGISRERARQIERNALTKLAENIGVCARDIIDVG